MYRSIPRTDLGHGGFALVSVLWILAILTVISLGFAGRAMLERRMAWYAVDHEAAQQLARAAAERGLFELRNKVFLDQYNEQLGYTGLDQRWAQTIDLFTEAEYFEGGREAPEGNVCEVRIEDAEGRISVNYAQEALLEGVEILNDRTISRILDLRSSSTAGYGPTFLHSIEELRGMQEFRDELWQGRPGKPGPAEVLTVWGDRGYSRINVNTASRAVLECLPDIEPDVVRKIIELRSGPDGRPNTPDDLAFRTVGELFTKLDVSAEKLAGVNQYCKADSRFFTINAHASRRRGKINAYCTVTVELRGTTPVILAWREGAVGASN